MGEPIQVKWEDELTTSLTKLTKRNAENKMSSESRFRPTREGSSFSTTPSRSVPCSDNPDLVRFPNQQSATNDNTAEVHFHEQTKLPRNLDCLKRTLKHNLYLMQSQDETIKELECQLRKAKEDLACLREKCDGKPRNFLELAKYEAKLKKFKEILLCVTFHLEKTLRGVTNCQTCTECTCKKVIVDEEVAIKCIKKDLESLQLRKCSVESGPALNESLERKSERGHKNSRPLNAEEVDCFRIKAITGVTALEEMKAQVDILHDLIKRVYDQLPCDYEKGLIDECENKLNKLRKEFDDITNSLSAFLESISDDQSDKCGGSGGSPSQKSEKICRLQTDEKLLEKEISENQTQLEKIKRNVKEVENELQEKICQSAQQDKELLAKQQEILKLREGVKSFREQLKDLQIDIASNIDDKTNIGPTGSYSNISILSDELQELCDILACSQNSFPGIIEKLKEDNHQMKTKVHKLETCLINKQKTLSIIQRTLKMREGQVDDLNSKINCLEMKVSELEKDIEKKNREICNAQESMEKAKELEMKIKDENIEELQFRICHLDHKLKAMVKQVMKKDKDLELLQDEILYVSSKNFFLNREIDLLEPKLAKLQKILILYENMVCNLESELSARETEIGELYDKLKELEEELELELKKYEQKSCEDSERINELSNTVVDLQNEFIKSRLTKGSSKRTERSTIKSGKCEDPCKKPDVKNLLEKIKNGFKLLKQQLKQSEKQDEVNSKITNLENLLKPGECQQQMYNDKINELQKILEETIASHECERNELMQKLCKEEDENLKIKRLVSTLNESIKCKNSTENSLKETIKRLTHRFEAVKSENSNLKEELSISQQKLKVGGSEDVEEMDKLINVLEAQKCDLKTECATLKCELDKEERTKRSLAQKIEELNNMLSQKTIQFDQLSQNCKCTAAKAQEALSKLKNAEDRLKCMKMEMNTRELCKAINEEDVNTGESIKRLEDALGAKTAECADLMCQIRSLEAKLKIMQSEYISVQVNKDCELDRVNRELVCLENELSFMHEENFKLKNEVSKIEDCTNKADKNYKDELEKKEKELSQVLCEKKTLLESVDDLQKKLEEICIDNTNKEEENIYLRNEYERIEKELNEVETELCETRKDLEALRTQYTETIEKLKITEQKMQNLKKLYFTVNQENAALQEAKDSIEKELCEVKGENLMLKEKMACEKKQNDAEIAKLINENSNASQESMRYCARIKDLSRKVKNLEENVIPHLEDEIVARDNCIENYKMELNEANANCQRMREESMRMIQCTKKYLAAQRNANEEVKTKMKGSKDNRYYSANENRELEEQLKAVTRLNEHLYFELQNKKNDYHDIEPRSFSPLPWGCSNVERDNSSPEYLAESGFQSMQQSPTNLNYINDFGSNMKRAPSQWNNNLGEHIKNKDYSPCRRSSVR